MPRVPVQDNLTVGRDPGRIANVPQPGRTFSDLAAEGQAFGEGVGLLGDTLQRIGREQDDLVARETAIEADAEMREEFNTKILSRRGKDSFGSAEDTAKLHDEVRKKHEGRLQNPAARRQFALRFNQRLPGYIDQGTKHEVDEKTVYQKFVRDEEKRAGLNEALADPLNPDAQQRGLNRGLESIQNNQPAGTPQEFIDSEAKAYRSSLHASLLQRMSKMNPAAAEQYFEAHKDEIDGVLHAQLTADIEKELTVQAEFMKADQLIAAHGTWDERLKAARNLPARIRPGVEGLLRSYRADDTNRLAAEQTARIEANSRNFQALLDQGASAEQLEDWRRTLPDDSERTKYKDEILQQFEEAPTPNSVWGRWNLASDEEKLRIFEEEGLSRFGLRGKEWRDGIDDVRRIKDGAKPAARAWAKEVLVGAGLDKRDDDEFIGRVLSEWEIQVRRTPGELSLEDQRKILLGLSRTDLELDDGSNFFGLNLNDPDLDTGIVDLLSTPEGEEQLSRIIVPEQDSLRIGRELREVGEAVTDDNIRRAFLLEILPSRQFEGP